MNIVLEDNEVCVNNEICFNEQFSIHLSDDEYSHINFNLFDFKFSEKIDENEDSFLSYEIVFEDDNHIIYLDDEKFINLVGEMVKKTLIELLDKGVDLIRS